MLTPPSSPRPFTADERTLPADTKGGQPPPAVSTQEEEKWDEGSPVTVVIATPVEKQHQWELSKEEQEEIDGLNRNLPHVMKRTAKNNFHTAAGGAVGFFLGSCLGFSSTNITIAMGVATGGGVLGGIAGALAVRYAKRCLDDRVLP